MKIPNWVVPGGIRSQLSKTWHAPLLWNCTLGYWEHSSLFNLWVKNQRASLSPKYHTIMHDMHIYDYKAGKKCEVVSLNQSIFLTTVLRSSLPQVCSMLLTVSSYIPMKHTHLHEMAPLKAHTTCVLYICVQIFKVTYQSNSNLTSAYISQN
jgi:hypothetical protein